MRVWNAYAIVCVLIASASMASAQVNQPQGSSASGQRSSRGAAGSGRHESKPLKVTAASPLWERYLSAGEQAKKAGDKEKAKQYFFAALTQLERKLPTKPEFNPHVCKLERDIMSLYPRLRANGMKKPGEEEQATPPVKVFEEEMGVMARLDRLSQYFPTASDATTANLARNVIQTQYRLASKEVEKAKTSEKQNGETHSTENKDAGTDNK